MNKGRKVIMAITRRTLHILHLLPNTNSSKKLQCKEAAKILDFCRGNHSASPRLFGCVSCKTHVLLLAACLALGVHVTLAVGEAYSHPETTQPGESALDSSWWRQARNTEYPYSYTSLNVPVTPHKTPSHSNADEEGHSRLGRSLMVDSEGSGISNPEEENLLDIGNQEKPQKGNTEMPEELEEEEQVGMLPLEGSWDAPESLDFSQDLLSGLDEHVEVQDEGNPGGGFLDLNDPDLVETEDKYALPGCHGSCRRQSDDALQTLEDDDDLNDLSSMRTLFEAGEDENQESFFAGAPELDTADEASFFNQDARVHEQTFDEGDELWDTDRSEHGATLPIEYTIEKYSDPANSIRRKQQFVSAAFSEAANTVDTNMVEHGTTSFDSPQNSSAAPEPAVHPAVEPHSAPQAANGTDTSYVSAGGVEATATAGKGAPLHAEEAGGAGGREEVVGHKRRAENGDLEDAEGAHLDEAELGGMEEGYEGTAGDEDDDASLFDDLEKEVSLPGESRPRELEAEEAAPAVIQEHQKLDTLTAEEMPSAAHVAAEAPPLEKKAPGRGDEEQKFDASHLQVAEDAAAAGRTLKTTQQVEAASSLVHADAAHHQQQRRIPVKSLLNPPSFIDWQTLGAVMTSPALRGSGSPFLAQAPQYFTSVPTEHTAQHGRILIVLFASMVVCLLIFLFCCCMVRRKRAHEAYMATPMTLK